MGPEIRSVVLAVVLSAILALAGAYSVYGITPPATKTTTVTSVTTITRILPPPVQPNVTEMPLLAVLSFINPYKLL